jgi:hypothetical protein
MTRAAKDAENLQVFRGSFQKLDVFAQNAGDGCCGPGAVQAFDKLGDRVHFDNALAHSNPTGANDKYRFPGGNGFATERAAIIAHINQYGVGAQISVLVIPTFAFVTALAIKTWAEEDGLTFNVVTRNGLGLPAGSERTITIEADEDNACAVTRTETVGDGDPSIYTGVGALADGVLAEYRIGRGGDGEFSLEADEIILEVATMPAGGVVSGLFDLDISVSYDVVRRCDEPF